MRSTQSTAPSSLYDVDVIRDARIPTGEEDVTLSADVYLPREAGPAPALVMVLPYRKDASVGIEQEPGLRWMARHGYACVLVDFRGTGSSDGLLRAPFEASEADDGVAAVDWAARQPWSTGSVGMWGLSYGAIMAMRTATRRPEALKAILPIMGAPDLERDCVHPHGVRGGQAPMPFWATGTLSDQLLPPLQAYHDEAEQRRWRQRLEESQPWIVDLARRGPGDAAWRERAIDATAITVPSFCVAGWWDLFRDGQIRAYEQIAGPKKLLVGPWMHILPQNSPFDAIDFLPLALRWWDHWLRGEDNGVMGEPAATVYVGGSRPGWRAYAAWPPSDGEVLLGTANDATLIAGAAGPREQVEPVVAYESDPTIGACGGRWTLIGQTFGLPLDQHDDDQRSACATSGPLTADLLIAGRPQVTVGLSSDSPTPARLVVRLCDVAPDGRSTLITSGVAAASGQVALYPAAYRVAAGHRLRVAISDSEFPRLWPLPDAAALAIFAVDLTLPTASEELGAAADVPAVTTTGDGPALGLWDEPTWRIVREPVGDAVEVVTGVASAARTTGRGHLLERRHEITSRVRRDAPRGASMTSTDTQTVRLASGERIEVRVRTRLTQDEVLTQGEVVIDDTAVFVRTWTAALPGA